MKSEVRKKKANGFNTKKGNNGGKSTNKQQKRELVEKILLFGGTKKDKVKAKREGKGKLLRDLAIWNWCDPSKGTPHAVVRHVES